MREGETDVLFPGLLTLKKQGICGVGMMNILILSRPLSMVSMEEYLGWFLSGTLFTDVAIIEIICLPF